MIPRGATELQHELLEKHVSKDLLDHFQICTSIPGKVPLDKNKINILWQKNSYDQNNLQEFFRNKSRFDEYDYMYLILIGRMKNLDTFFKYQKTKV